MQQYSTEVLQQITDLAALFLTPREISIMLELPAEEIIMACDLCPESEIYKAFYTGRLQSEVDLRKGIIKLAKSGSSPAQSLAMDLLMKSKVKMIDK